MTVTINKGSKKGNKELVLYIRRQNTKVVLFSVAMSSSSWYDHDDENYYNDDDEDNGNDYDDGSMTFKLRRWWWYGNEDNGDIQCVLAYSKFTPLSDVLFVLEADYVIINKMMLTAPKHEHLQL